MRRPTTTLSLTATLLYAFLYAPIVVVVVYSFNAARFGAAWNGFTTHWYADLLKNEAALQAARNTLILAAASTAVSTLLGTMLGYALSRFAFPGRRLLERVLHVPVFIPDIVLAVSLLLFFALLRNWLRLMEPGLVTMILAHVTFQLSFVTIVVRTRMVGLDTTLEEAARDLGANEWRTFRHITLPLMLPGVLAGAMMAFTLSLDDFVVSFFTSGPGSTTLPILIYSSVKRGITPDINALSTFIILASLAGAVLVTVLRRPQDQRISR